MANAWTRDAGAGVMNAPPLLGGFRSRGQLIPPFAPCPAPGNLAPAFRPSIQGQNRRCPPAVGRDEPKTNTIFGNGIRLETFGRIRPQEADIRLPTPLIRRCSDGVDSPRIWAHMLINTGATNVTVSESLALGTAA